MTREAEVSEILGKFKSEVKNLPTVDQAAVTAAQDRQANLTKPPGSLGRLEDIAIHFSGWQACSTPHLDHGCVLIFAGTHGVAASGVSAYPPEVTHQMVGNFQAGGAAINHLAKAAGLDLHVVALDLDHPTAPFHEAPAMTHAELANALEQGRHAIPTGCDLLALGEMGIANTTSAAALYTAILGGAAADWVGPGTGVHGEQLAHKRAVIEQAIALHGKALQDPLEALRCIGGRELAATAGAILEARLRRIPVILDGFGVTAAASILFGLDKRALDHCLAGHVSAEPAHRRAMQAMALHPILDLGLRLGEGSGAATAALVVRAALAAHNGMATFAEAGVANKAS